MSDQGVQTMLGDCLALMPLIPDGAVDMILCDLPVSEIIRLYDTERWTLRQVADKYNTDHHRIKRILQRCGVEITRTGRRRKEFTDEHRAKISASNKGRSTWCQGKKLPESFRRANMKGRLGTRINLNDYPDYDRLLFLSRILSRHKKHHGMDDNSRKAFLDKFYFDPAFNAIYDAWIYHLKSKWWYPSLDHINPKAAGGTFDLDNLQILTWFENRAKADMLASEWDEFKFMTGTKSDLFIEEILAKLNT